MISRLGIAIVQYRSVEYPKFIVVIGTSAGGRNALIEFVSQLKIDMNAAFFIAMHLSKRGLGEYLVRQLQSYTPLACEVAKDGAPIEAGHIYVAPSNGHLLVKKEKVVIGHGPEENRWRPSIDVLFRSAAAAYSTHVIGIILTGLLNDGTSGMHAIKQSGGVCIVQNPEEAEYPDMSLSVLDQMEVDYNIGLGEVGQVLTDVLRRNPPENPAPPQVLAEARLAEKTAIGLESVVALGDKSLYACPDCGGGLWKISENGRSRYRCHIGHSYQENDLLFKQGEHIESTLWVALRMMEERSHLLSKVGKEHLKKGLAHLGSSYLQKAEELNQYINTLKEVLINAQKAAVQ